LPITKQDGNLNLLRQFESRKFK